ncbi:hypothetical protein ACAW74_16400 [Fibrella sp. WM1]|uniref:hypothetical protein n=1 Tax=Fibrella musci TaxID=3242485 RepID=UPI00351FE7C2
MSLLRSTGQFEQDAWVTIMLYRKKAEKEAAKVESRPFREPYMTYQLEYGIVENRYGYTGTVTLYCDVATNVLLNTTPTSLDSNRFVTL